jgi:hypothetical protein
MYNGKAFQPVKGLINTVAVIAVVEIGRLAAAAATVLYVLNRLLLPN